MRILIFVLLALSLLNCNTENKPPQPPSDTLFSRISPEESGIDFVNEVVNGPDFNIFRYRNFYNGGGVALGDVNNDGLPDVYLTRNQGKNKLYLNKGNFQFEDITEAAGVGGTKAWSTGVTLVDINNDGWLDIYVCNAGYVEGDDQQNELFINNGLSLPEAEGESPGLAANSKPVPPPSEGVRGRLAFTERAADYNLNESGYTTHTAFFDYDLDGDLDAYILNNSFIPVNTLNYSNKRELDAEDWPVADFLKGGGDKLMRNDNGRFTDVTSQAKIFSSLIGFGLGVAVGDVNGDQWPDLYISNDFFERDYLYINQQDGTFKEDITNWMEHISLFSMGADMADINNDGYPEIFATDMLPDDDHRLKSTTVFDNYNLYLMKLQRGFYHQYMHNTLQLNNQNGSFSEIAYYSGVSASDWSWGALLFDADNDGYRDIFVCNGIYHDLTNQDFISFFANDVIQKMVLTGEKEDLQNIIDKMPSTPVPNRMFHNNQDLTFNEVSEAWGLAEPSFSNGAAYADLDNDGDLDLVINNMNQQAMVYRNHTAEKTGNHYLQIFLEGPENNRYAIGAKAYLFQGETTHYAELVPTRGFQSSVDYRLHFGLGKGSGLDSLRIIWPDRSRSLAIRPPADTLLVIRYQDAGRETMASSTSAQAQANPLMKEVEIDMPEHKEDRFIDFFQEGLTIRMLSRQGPRAVTADVDGDGQEDVFIGGASGFPGQLLRQQGGAFSPSSIKTFERDSYHEDTAAAFFDADGDGDPDLYVGSGGNLPPPNTRYLQDRLYLNDGKGNFERRNDALPARLLNTAEVVPWDFDGDGDLDVFVASRSIPNVYGVDPPHALYENDGKGKFTNVIARVAPSLENIGMITAAKLVNLIGNDEPELLVVGEWMSPMIFARDGGAIKKMDSNLEDYHGWWSGLATADLDGDGDEDLVLGNRGENFYFTGTPEAPAKLWVADFDRNGTIEKVITRSIDGRDMPVPMKGELTGQVVSLKKQNLKHEDYAKRSIQELFGEEALRDALMKKANYFKSAIAINEGNGQFTLKPLPPEVQFSCICGVYCADLNGDDQMDLVLGGNESGFLPQFSKLDASFGHVLINQGEGSFQPIRQRESGFFVKGDIKQMLPLSLNGSPYLLVLINNKKPKLYRLSDQKLAN